MRDLTHAEWKLLAARSAAPLAHGQAQVEHLSAKFALAPTGQHQIGRCLLARTPAGAVVDVLAEVIDAKPAAIGCFRSPPQDLHDPLSDCAVALSALHPIPRTGRNCVDEHQA